MSRTRRMRQPGFRVWSLYAGQNRRPNEEMLRDIDVLVFDIQDVGARFYTYMCTMTNAMQEAAKRNIEFVVLDRPNPIRRPAAWKVRFSTRH